MAGKWSIATKEPSTASSASIVESTGVATFPANQSTTTDNVYTITYTDDNGCVSTTDYTVKKKTSAESAFTHTDVEGCVSWTLESPVNVHHPKAHTSEWVITGTSINTSGEYGEVSFGCLDTTWSATVTHTGTSWTMTISRPSAEYKYYPPNSGLIGSINANLGDGVKSQYTFPICTEKMEVYLDIMLVNQSGDKTLNNPTSLGVKFKPQVDTDVALTFTGRIRTAGASQYTPHDVPECGYGDGSYKDEYMSYTCTIPTGWAEYGWFFDSNMNIPATAVPWHFPLESGLGWGTCFPFEYFDTAGHDTVLVPTSDTIETTKYIWNVRFSN